MLGQEWKNMPPTVCLALVPLAPLPIGLSAAWSFAYFIDLCTLVL